MTKTKLALSAIAVSLGIASAASKATSIPAVEYYHAGFDHYFMTANPEEIRILDGGAYGGAWKRTGESFTVSQTEDAGTLGVCRFFSVSFAPKSSHFLHSTPIRMFHC